MDALDDVLDAQHRLGEVLQQMKVVVDRLAGTARQLEMARAEAVQMRKQVHDWLQRAQTDAQMILETAKANAEELIANAERRRKQIAANEEAAG